MKHVLELELLVLVPEYSQWRGTPDISNGIAFAGPGIYGLKHWMAQPDFL